VLAVEKNWGPDYLRLGPGLSSDFSGDAFFNLLGSYRQTWLNSLGAEWRTDVQLGRTSGLYTEFYQPLWEETHPQDQEQSCQGNRRCCSSALTSSQYLKNEPRLDHLLLEQRRYAWVRRGVATPLNRISWHAPTLAFTEPEPPEQASRRPAPGTDQPLHSAVAGASATRTAPPGTGCGQSPVPPGS